MSLVDVILSRRSIRSYKAEAIPDDVLNKILEAGRQAPSADNAQPWRFIIVTDQAIKEKLSRGRWSGFVKDSAVTIVGCGFVGDEDAREWSTIDVAIALQNMVIAAWAQGVGSCWIGDFIEEEVKSTLNIPEDWKVVALVAFGYPDEKPQKTGRKPLKEIVNYNKF